MNSYELERAARQFAKQLIRPYVARGDSFKSLKASHLGVSCMGARASIGGLMNGKSWSTDFIIVPMSDGQETNAAFKLRDIFGEVEGEIKSAAALEDFRLEPG